MAFDLTAEFEAGRAARVAAGRCLEHLKGETGDCPYLATSPAADSWWAGWAHECNSMAANRDLGQVKKAAPSRGHSIRATLKGGGFIIYRMDYERTHCPAYAEA